MRNDSLRTATRGTLRRLAAIALLPLLGACATVSEFRKLEYEVNRLKTGGTREDATSADLRAELNALRDEVARLEGRIEESEHAAQSALAEAKAARQAAAGGSAAAAPIEGPPGGEAVPGSAPSAAEELQAYRAGYDAWRTDANQECIDRFGQFLQSFPSSQYADDAAFWMADCYYKQGNYKTAVLRFDDVARLYPKSDKASEALYRQGEALQRLGPAYAKAAEKAFKRVVDEYPDSKRAREASEQLQALRAG
jgi:tol-pal system protein YbgF